MLRALGGLLKDPRRYLQGQIKFVGRSVGWGMDGLVGSGIEAKTSRVEGLLFVVLSPLILPHSQRISSGKK